MSPKKNPLEDARKRLQEKIDSIKEHSDYIIQVLNTTVSNVVDPAVELLNQKERKKFFNKYSQVSQNLEKCLDFLLVLSDTVANPRDDSDESGSSDEEGDSTKEKSKNAKKKKDEDDGRCEREVNKVENIKTPAAEEEKPANEEKTVNNKTNLSDKSGSTSTKTGSENKGASSLSKTSNSIQPRKNPKSPQESKPKINDGFQKTVKSDENQLSSVKPSNFDVKTKNKQDKAQTSGKSSSISPLQESAFKRFVPTQIKMPQQKNINNKTGRNSPGQAKLLQPSPDVSSAGKQSPMQTKPIPPSSRGSQTDLSGTGRKSPAQGQKPVKGSRRESATRVFHLKPYPFTNGQCLEVVVTEVSSPWELWIQPTGDGFNLLMEKMCMQFAKAAALGYKGGLSSPPSVGEYCCARFTVDDTWYRARVVGIHQSEDPTKQTEGHRQRNSSSSSSSSSTSSIDNSSPGLEVEVLCIDDGNRERLPLSRLRALDDNLSVVPCQALCCALAGVKPLVQNTVKSQGDSVWKEDAIEWLRNKVSGTKLLAFPKKVDEDQFIMVDLYFAPSRRKSSQTIEQGNNKALPGLQYSIGNIMVMEGFAQRIDEGISQPDETKNTSPRSVSSEGILSRSCSSISVASLQDCAMPVFEGPVKEEISVTQERSVMQDSPVSSVVTQANTVTQDSSVVRDSVVTYGSGFTHGSDTVRDSKVEQSVAQGGGPTVKGQLQKTPRTQSVTQQQNSTHFKQRSTTKDEENLTVAQSTNDQEMDTVSNDSSLVKRQFPPHPPEGSSLTGSLEDQQDMDNGCEENKKRAYLPSQDQPLLLQVMMAEASSPSDFYVHLVTPEAALLAELTADLDSYYKNSDVSSTPTDYRLNIGDYCCSKFTADDMWCRARVIDVNVFSSVDRHDSEAVRADIHVFYLDYGNCEWVSMENTRLLLPKFMILPGFAVRCRLAGVKPVVSQDENTAMSSNEVPCPGEPGTTSEAPRRQEPETSTSTDTLAKSAGPDADQGTNNLPISDGCDNESLESTNRNSPGKSGKSNEKEEQSVFKFSSGKNKGRLPRGRRGKKYRKMVLDKNAVERAAGDESGDSELSDGLVLEWPEDEDEGTKAKGEEESALPEKYLLPSPDQEPTESIKLHKTGEMVHYEWREEAIELFKGLTGDDKPLTGIMVPWNARIYQQVYYPTTSTQDGNRIDITYKRPTLALKLYDTTGEDDIDIGQVLVDTGLAEVYEEQVKEFFPIKEEGKDKARTIQMSLTDLESTADQLEQEGGSSSPVGSRRSSSDEEALQFWNPMMEDYVSSTNSYRINPDDLDIALRGFKPIEDQVCRFFQSKRSRCWRGENCPLLHVKKGEDASMAVQAFCDNNDSTVDPPGLGSWVAVRVTAVLNPGHFWVQFPWGTGPIDKRIMEARLGLSGDKEEEEDENFEAMTERLNNFYSRNLFRDSSSLLPAMGELVVAKYSSNDTWYRARVTDVKEGELQVYFVDYGNTEWTAECNVKRMLPQFLHIPFQAVECFLANVETIEEDGEWPDEASELFESLTQDKLLIACVLSIACNNTIYVELYDTNDDEVNINKEMIKKGFAIESSIRIDKPQVKSVTTSDEDSSDCEIIEMPG